MSCLVNTSICIWCLKVLQNQARLCPNIIQSAKSHCNTGCWEQNIHVVMLRWKTQSHAHSSACRARWGKQWRSRLRETWWQGESRHNDFNNVQCSLKHSSQPRRCHSCQISGAEIWLVLSGSSPYGLSAWQHCDPQQMCCLPPVLDSASLTHLCFLPSFTITSTIETVGFALLSQQRILGSNRTHFEKKKKLASLWALLK